MNIQTVGLAAHIIRRYRNWPAVLLSLSANRRPTLLSVRGGPTLEAPPDSSLMEIVEEVYFSRRYTPKGWEISPTDTVVDIGANVGAFTLYAAARTRGRVVALEPLAENVDLLKSNIRRNGGQNVDAVQTAVSDKSGTARLYDGGISSGHLLFDRNINGPLDRYVEVPTVTLEAALDECGVTSVGFLKMDCEGAEGLIFATASPSLWRRIDRVAMEYHDNVSPLKHRELRRILESAGFTCRTEPGAGWPFGYLYGRRAQG